MEMSSRPRRFSWIALPLLPWALHFVAIYSLQGLVCARGWSQPLGMAGMVALTLLAFVAIAWIGLRARRALHGGRGGRDGGQQSNRQEGERESGRFAARVALLLSALSLVAVAFTALPLVLLAPCE